VQLGGQTRPPEHLPEPCLHHGVSVGDGLRKASTEPASADVVPGSGDDGGDPIRDHGALGQPLLRLSDDEGRRQHRSRIDQRPLPGRHAQAVHQPDVDVGQHPRAMNEHPRAERERRRPMGELHQTAVEVPCAVERERRTVRHDPTRSDGEQTRHQMLELVDRCGRMAVDALVHPHELASTDEPGQLSFRQPEAETVAGAEQAPVRREVLEDPSVHTRM
jgi:hypothetical protein